MTIGHYMVECYYIKPPIGLRSISSSFDSSAHTDFSSHTSKQQETNNNHNQNEIPSILCCTRRRYLLRLLCLRRRTVSKTVVSIGRSCRRCRRPQQARPVRFALRGRPVRRVALRRITLRGFTVCSITVRGLALCRFPVRRRALRRTSSPVRRSVVLRHLPCLQDFRFTVRLLPVSGRLTTVYEE